MLALITVLGIVSATLSTVDTSTLPPALVGVVEVLKYGFLAAPIALGLGFARNLVGYGIAWLRESRKDDLEEIEYSMKWLSQTLVTFNGWVLTVTPFVDIFIMQLPPEQKAVAMTVTGSAFAMIDLLISEIKHVIGALKQSG